MLKLVSLIALLLGVSGQSTDSPNHPDEVTSFPFLTKAPNFKFYAGYLDIGNDKALYYWFAESQRNPSKDPLVWWQNGGPGASSISGLLTELGPFDVQDDGSALPRQWAWNRQANLLAFDNPYGVGFSRNDRNKNYTTNDDQTADDNYKALQAFYARHPDYRSRDLYVTGESYAGVYLPTFVERIVDGQATFKVNLKGLAMGNPITNWAFKRESNLRFAYYHSLIDEEGWWDVVEQCCGPDSRKDRIPNDYCHFDGCEYNATIRRVPAFRYNVYKRCTTKPDYGVKFSGLQAFHDYMDDLSVKPEEIYCTTPGDSIMLNRRDVKRSIHVPVDQEWFTYGINYTRTYQDMKPTIQKLLNASVPITYYYGDWDSVCDFLSGQMFMKELDLPVKEYSKPWYVDEGVLAGRIVKYEGLDFVTVRDSGHFVPADQPYAAFKLLEYILGQRDKL